jgi:hypothetical protein
VSYFHILLTLEEYAKPSVQQSLLQFGIMRSPSSALINKYDESSILHQLRQETKKLLAGIDFSDIAQNLYYVRAHNCLTVAAADHDIDFRVPYRTIVQCTAPLD